MKRLHYLAALPLLIVAACSTAPPPPINDLASAETALLAADQLILVYETLPACPLASPVCQSPEVRAGLKAAAARAFAAMAPMYFRW